MESQQRIWPWNAAQVELGVPGCAVVDAHAEPLAAQKVPQHLVGEA
jgi:hypothetical protein